MLFHHHRLVLLRRDHVKALLGPKAVRPYAVIAVLCIVVGSVQKVDLVWNMSDMFNGLMVIPNLLGVLALSGVVAKLARGGKPRPTRPRKKPPPAPQRLNRTKCKNVLPPIGKQGVFYHIV